MEQYKRVFNFLCSMILVLIYSKGFDIVWNDYYNKGMHDPFWHNGNILMVIVYAGVYIICTRAFKGFRLGYSKWQGLFGSQILGLIGTNSIEFLLISFIGRGRLNIKPILIMTLIQLGISFVWCLAFSFLYTKLYPPRKMLMIYGNRNVAYLIKKMSIRNDKYEICKTIEYHQNINIIKREILKYDAVVISDIPGELRNKLLKFTFDNSIRTYINPKLSDIILRGAEDFHLFDTPLLLARNDGLRWEQKVLKRVVDIVMSAILLVLTSPIFLIVSLLIKLYDGGPVFYSQERLTYGGKIFKVHKFRSMIVNAEKNGKARLASKNDDRITPIGTVIRKLRIDELPQLINIFVGEMSFVGPRPERPELAKKYEKTMPEFKYRLKVKAGLTGYAQVMGKYNTTPYDKLKLDLMYIENHSFWQDMKIIVDTIKICFVPEATEGVDDKGPIETHREKENNT